MRTKNYWFVSGFYSIGSKIGTLLFGFGSFFILIRSLDKSHFGVWALFLTITSLIETSRNGLIQNALIKFLHSNTKDFESKIITASLFLNVTYSLIMAILLLVVAYPLSKIFGAVDLSPMFGWYSLTLILLVPISQFNYLQQANFSFSGVFWTTLVRQGTFFIGVLLSILFNGKLNLVNLVQLQVACAVMAMFVAYFCAKPLLNFNLVWDWIMVKKVFSFGKFVMGTNIFSLAYKSMDQLMVGYFMNPTSVAYYNSAIRVSNLIEYPASSVAEIVYPKTTHQYQLDKEKASKFFYEMGVGLTMTLTVPIIVFTMFFADFIILLIAGSEYAESANILRITILFGLFTPFSRQFGAAMDSSGRPHINFLVLVVSLLLNGFLSYVGIKIYGILGVAYGVLTSYIIMGIICFILMYRIFDVSFRNIIRQMFIAYNKSFFWLMKRIDKRYER